MRKSRKHKKRYMHRTIRTLKYRSLYGASQGGSVRDIRTLFY
jgi:hypothetical protein